MWKIERKPWYKPYKPYYWIVIHSAYGLAEGETWTRRGAEKQLLMAQGRMFAS